MQVVMTNISDRRYWGPLLTVSASGAATLLVFPTSDITIRLGRTGISRSWRLGRCG